MKLLPVFIFIVPGMICYALAKNGYAGLTQLVQDGQPVRDECQAAFPLMVKYVLPVGVRGIVVAGLLSALMSSLAGVFNACSTLFTMDLYQKFRPQASQRNLVWIGRVATAAMVLIGLFWIPVIRGQKGSVFLLAGGPRLPGSPDLRRVFPRRVLQATQQQGLPRGACRGFPAGCLPLGD